MNECICRCRCGRVPDADADGLCLRCWQAWQAPGDGPEHAPIADRSYLGTFGLSGIWTPWLMNRAEGRFLGMHPSVVHDTPPPENCPKCKNPMVFRAEGWKCYRHEPWIVIKHPDNLPRVPEEARLPL